MKLYNELPHFLDIETEACRCPIACWSLVTKHYYSPICLEQVFGTKDTVQVFFTYIMTGFRLCLNTKTWLRANLSKHKGIYTCQSLWIIVTKSEPDLTPCMNFIISKLPLNPGARCLQLEKYLTGWQPRYFTKWPPCYFTRWLPCYFTR